MRYGVTLQGVDDPAGFDDRVRGLLAVAEEARDGLSLALRAATEAVEDARAQLGLRPSMVLEPSPHPGISIRKYRPPGRPAGPSRRPAAVPAPSPDPGQPPPRPADPGPAEGLAPAEYLLSLVAPVMGIREGD